MKLHCPRCDMDLDRIAWRYTEPIDDYAKWEEETGRYEYEDTVDKGDISCITLCYYCGDQLKNFGYTADYDTAMSKKE